MTPEEARERFASARCVRIATADNVVANPQVSLLAGHYVDDDWDAPGWAA